MKNLLGEALTYLDMGWGVYPAHSIDQNGSCSCGNILCPCPGKHPVGRWLEYQNRIPTKNEVKLWFNSLDCNIGTITGGVSGIVVVDVDGQTGVDSLPSLHLEHTLMSRTGSGGFHLFYSLKENQPVQTRTKVVPGIDIRADGGFVVLPPSRHKSGHPYEWVDIVKLAPFDPEPFTKTPLYTNGSTLDPDWASEYLNGVPEGMRSLTAARLSGRYFGRGLTFNEAWILISHWNELNDPPLPENELRKTFEAVHRKHESTMESTEIVTMAQIRALFT